MNFKYVFQNRALRAGLCILLTALLLLSLLVPALSGGFTQLNKPDADVEIQDIQVLHTGDEENPEASSKENSSEADGQGNGQETDEVREDGREVNGESEEKTQGVSQQEKAENIGGTADPQSGPAVEDLSNATVGTTSSTDDMGEEGQNDGKQGDEGGEEVPLDAVAVMSWQKYGREERSIVCQGGSVVAKKILLAQLDDNVLEYDFYISGSDAEKLRITGIKYAIGDSLPEYIDESGSIDVAVPTDPGFRNYIFTVEAMETGADSEGRNIEKPVDFTFVIRCETGYDLELQLHWEKADTGDSVITCSANDSAGREINRSETGSVLKYGAELVGGLAENSSIIAAEYTTASGGYGTINTDSGTLELSTPEGSDRETYYLRFTAETKMKDDEGAWVEDTVSYTVSIVYIDNLDLQLSFKWYEKGISERELICDLNSHVTADVKLNQL
ncbi:MAG: hypothetical protein IJ364_07355, partial [Oscillospiraceae bacterium]|nr:hypothetical protein [Oscillospiraceae bacterium]